MPARVSSPDSPCHLGRAMVLLRYEILLCLLRLMKPHRRMSHIVIPRSSYVGKGTVTIPVRCRFTSECSSDRKYGQTVRDGSHQLTRSSLVPRCDLAWPNGKVEAFCYMHMNIRFHGDRHETSSVSWVSQCQRLETALCSATI